MHITLVVIAFLVCVVNQPRRPPLLPPVFSVYTNSLSLFSLFIPSLVPHIHTSLIILFGLCYWFFRLFVLRGRLHPRISAGDDVPAPPSVGIAMGITPPFGAYMPSSSCWGQAVSP